MCAQMHATEIDFSSRLLVVWCLYVTGIVWVSGHNLYRECLKHAVKCIYTTFGVKEVSTWTCTEISVSGPNLLYSEFVYAYNHIFTCILKVVLGPSPLLSLLVLIESLLGCQWYASASTTSIYFRNAKSISCTYYSMQIMNSLSPTYKILPDLWHAACFGLDSLLINQFWNPSSCLWGGIFQEWYNHWVCSFLSLPLAKKESSNYRGNLSRWCLPAKN